MNELSPYEIVTTALQNLEKETSIRGRWNEMDNRLLDGQLTLKLNGQEVVLNAEIKNTITPAQLNQIQVISEKHSPLITIGYRISPNVKAQLRKRNMAYLEGSGNIFLRNDHSLLFVDTAKTLPAPKGRPEKAFTRTGLKVIFQVLIDAELVNKPYREIAEETGVALGVVHNVINGLRKLEFLVKTGAAEFIFMNKRELLNLWVNNYGSKLKPSLYLGRFRFLDDTDFGRWQSIALSPKKTYWGSEPAGDLLTNYLKPAALTLYTTETRKELMKNYRLIPDEKGKVHVYQKFWKTESGDKKTAPKILIYADLMNTGEKRYMETAEKIYEQYLQNQF